MSANCLLLLVLVLNAASASRYKYTFAQEWPGSICRHNSCQHAYLGNYAGTEFSLHGLWPEIDTQTGTCQRIEQCRTEGYNPASISSTTLSEMDHYWVGFYSSTDWFRDHEWTKHGTCWNAPSIDFLQSVATQEQYFSKVLSLRSKLDLMGGFRAVGVVPSDSAIYTLKQVEDAIKYAISRAFSVVPSTSQFTLLCYQGMLEQIYICFDENYNPTQCDCKISTESNDACSASSIKLPTFRF